MYILNIIIYIYITNKYIFIYIFKEISQNMEENNQEIEKK